MSACHSCGGQGQPLGFAERQPLARCAQCGLVFAERWQTEFNPLHEEVYARHLKADYRYDPLNIARIGEILARAAKSVRGRRLLDVGCGHGEVVHTAASAGWGARGIDLSPSAIEICLRHGLNCSATDFFDSALDSERFDVIVMSELIEHVPAPVRFLKRAHELLGDGGLLYLTTPNFDCLSRRVLRGDWPPIHPEHISYFTSETLRAAARRAGLATEAVSTRNLSMAMAQWLRARLVRPARERGGSAQPSQPAANPGGEQTTDPTQSLRGQIARSRALRGARNLVNAGLNITGTGETLVAWLRRPVR